VPGRFGKSTSDAICQERVAASHIDRSMKSQPAGITAPSLRLRWEVALALAVKIALVILIKIIFFSDPPSKAEVSIKVAERLTGSAQPAATTEIPTSTHHRE
jgi:hypothetical protein